MLREHRLQLWVVGGQSSGCSQSWGSGVSNIAREKRGKGQGDPAQVFQRRMRLLTTDVALGNAEVSFGGCLSRPEVRLAL